MTDGRPLTRRNLLLLAANTAAITLVPHLALANTTTSDASLNRCSQSLSGDMIRQDLSKSQIDNLVNKQTEYEIAQILEAAQKADQALPLRARPRYKTVTGKTKIVSTGYKKTQGLPPGGVNMRHGGSINITPNGGSPISISVNFGTPFGSLGVSLPISKRIGTPTANSFNINIPADKHYYTVTVNTRYSTKPYIVYKYDANGKKSVYHRGTSYPVYQSHSFNIVRVS